MGLSQLLKRRLSGVKEHMELQVLCREGGWGGRLQTKLGMLEFLELSLQGCAKRD